jgi:hypothetical protein
MNPFRICVVLSGIQFFATVKTLSAYHEVVRHFKFRKTLDAADFTGKCILHNLPYLLL